jgi:transcription elongation factor Elf1
MATDDTTQITCECCGSAEVEICLPAHFKANGDNALVSVDWEAEALTYWCPSCGDDVAVRQPDGDVCRGRWDRY